MHPGAGVAAFEQSSPAAPHGSRQILRDESARGFRGANVAATAGRGRSPGSGNAKKPRLLSREAGAFFQAEHRTTEAEGLEPPKACARRISSAVPYQLDYASNDLSDTQVGTAGFEPATPRSRSECSTGLSHVPRYYPTERTGWDSNPRGLLTPHDFQSCSLSRSDTGPRRSGEGGIRTRVCLLGRTV